MKIVLFSSDKAIEKFYDFLSKEGFEVVAIISESAKKQGRKLEVKDNPAAAFAKKEGIKLMTPDKYDPNTITEITNTGANIGFVFAYGKIIPEKIIQLFPFGIINLHPSLLPKFRGPAPLQATLLNGQQETGYSIIKINDKMDAGDILFQKNISIKATDDFATLRGRIINDSAENMPRIINKYLSGQISPVKQDDSQATYTKLIIKDDAEVSNSDNAESAFNKIRAYSNWPKAFLLIEGKRFIIHGAKITDDKLEIINIQPEGKKIMSFNDFKNGHHSLLTKFPSFVKVS